jgi:GH25 family lysozyme M1 (1,4-beta-N-acetylmuramidase)
MIRGIDISHNNGLSVINNLPADVAFVSLKGTQGATFQDPDFQTFYHELRNQHPEKVRIDYHFFDWEADGEPQVNNVLSRGVNYTEPGTSPLMLDLEADSGSAEETFVINNRALCIQRVNNFIAALYADPRYGRKDIIIYSNDDFIKNVICHTWPDAIFWVASYQPTPPPFIPGWAYKIWQYSEYGQLNGATTGGNTDLDQWMGTQEELNALANITA